MSNLDLNEYAGSVAVIGLSGRFPEANNVEEFWNNILQGKESVRVIEGLKSKNKNHINIFGYLDRIEYFDAEYFGFSPREAEIMDPQQRAMLECAVEALENSGYVSGKFNGKASVYLGSAISSYLIFNILSRKDLINSYGLLQISNGNDSISTPISYKLNLTGPSIDVNTTCSTSLIAVHQACRSLLNYESDLSLAGGVSINVTQDEGYIYQEGSILSPDGHCRPFDEKAQGTVEGNGLGVVVLKRLEDAIADNDTIHCIIRASAANNDGSEKIGYTAPSVRGQARVIAEALEIANIPSDHISYVETHGTGTHLGDPIEINALKEAFESRKISDFNCGLGSVKANIGHLNTAAGIAGLIKIILSLKNKKIPPSINFNNPNPKIQFNNSGFYVNAKLKDWNECYLPRRAAVSSFGIGGTNAHVIVEEAPLKNKRDSLRSQHIFITSAKSETALSAANLNLAGYLEKTEENLADVAFTLQMGRNEFKHRSFFVSNTKNDCIDKILSKNNKFIYSNKAPQHKMDLVFMFPGQGSQYINMAYHLYLEEEIFKENFDICCQLVDKYLDMKIKNILFSQENIQNEILNQTYVTQPVLFVIEYCLVKLLGHYGVEPNAMIGHSIGEYVAACIAEVFTLQDAIKIVCMRGKYMQELASGKMLSVVLSESELKKYLENDMSLAAINGKNLCVASGSQVAMERLQKKLSFHNIESKLLFTSHAFHSQQMEEMLPKFKNILKTVQFNAPKIRFISNLSGKWILNEEATHLDYWAQHIVKTVRFSEGLETLLQNENNIYLEVGPGHSLINMLKNTNDSHATTLMTMPHAKEDKSSTIAFLETLGKLWLNGIAIKWENIYTHESRGRIPLPTYPFQRQRYWIDKGKGESINIRNDSTDWLYGQIWKRQSYERLIDYKDEKQKIIKYLYLLNKDDLSDLDYLMRNNKNSFFAIDSDNFAKIDENKYSIEYSQQNHFEKVLKLISLEKNEELRIVYISKNICIFDLLNLIKSIIKCKIINSICISCITEQAYLVNGCEQNIRPESSLFIGVLKSVSQEFPNINYLHLDLDNFLQYSKDILNFIEKEFSSERRNSIVAYRNKLRWLPTFENIKLTQNKNISSHLKEGGVYLITGGLGNIGLALAGILGKEYKAKIVLISRTDFPDDGQWKNIIENNDSSTLLVKRIKRLNELKEDGVETLLLKANVADYEEMSDALRQAERKFGIVHGIIHAAADLKEESFKIVEELTENDFRSHFKAKIEGVKVLEKLLHNKTFDFCCLFSSISSILAGLGHAAYAAANIYLDEFVQINNNSILNTPLISINWDAWVFENENLSHFEEKLMDLSISEGEGCQVFLDIMNSGFLGRVIVSTKNLDERIQSWINQENKSNQKKGEDFNKNHSRPNLLNPYLAPRDEIEINIIEILESLLGIKGIGITDNFFELGGHSLLATKLTAQVRENFQIEFSLQTLFENPTAIKMSEYIIQKKLSEIDENLLNKLMEDL
ncbi:type I polyketide synthase [Fluviispira multicolorata]|uniref:Acyltransferase domain-containing protein n=1 Tax=Fluviispira multicolorata TaxID=2654512 RepID=A0A833JD36_9BACT|nr:type I polyketide synthase [Fluviispira multicolorata]KAB8028093.1 acyltransferase domain-containing protein [Fluviispira multicolorata]